MSEILAEGDVELAEDEAIHPDQEVNRLSVFNLSLVTFFVVFGLSMVSPILPTYAESFHVSYTLVGVVISSYAITRMVLNLPAGILSGIYDKRRIMILGLVLLSVSSVLAGFAPTYIALVLARMIEGSGSAMYVTAATVLLTQICGEEQRGQYMSLYIGILLLGFILGPTFGGFLTQAYDMSAPFFVYAVLTGLAIIPTVVLPEVSNSKNTSSSLEPRDTLNDIRDILSNRQFVLVNFTVFTMFLLRTGVQSMLVPLFASNNLGLDSGAIGLILTIAGITMTLTITPIGRVSDRIGRKIPLAVCIVLTALTVLWIPSATDFFSLSLILGAYGAVIGLSGPSAAFVADVSPQDKLEVSVALYRTIGDFGYVVGPTLLGFIADQTATPVPGASHSGLIGIEPFIVAALILAFAFLGLLKVRDPMRNKNQ
ncbi:MAG: MFS transporter [Candidatus Thorarchaeota archaeon]